jgi:hypothetical protein
MANRQLALGTISFAICFAAWGLISAFATRFREIYNLSASQTAFLIAAPVLLGSLARIPMGAVILGDSAAPGADCVELFHAAGGRILSRHGRIVVRSRRRFRIAVVRA